MHGYSEQNNEIIDHKTEVFRPRGLNSPSVADIHCIQGTRNRRCASCSSSEK